MKHRLIAPVADIKGTPDIMTRGNLDSQLVYGEEFIVVEDTDGWSRGAAAHDGYPGHMESKYLSLALPPPTHIVTAARTLSYKDPTMKSPLLMIFSFGSLVTVTDTDKGWVQVDHGLWVYEKHIAPIAALEKDYLVTAKKFLETPYYWGGRSGFGIDCSGLVQACLNRAGISIPRDSKDQEKALPHEMDTPHEGDIVFFPGHVGLMVDDKSLLHANAFHMKTVIEPLADVVARGSTITSIRQP